MLTVGVDLAAEPVNTAVTRILWTSGRAEIQGLVIGADDAVLVAEIGVADKAGIDCPLGWPRRFVEFVAQHQAGAFVAPVDVVGRDWRRLLANRETDLVTRDVVGLVPLSVAADRIGLAAMRCAGLLARLAAEGRPVDRSGAGVVVEVYPAAALKHWELPFRGYKGAVNAGVRDEMVDRLGVMYRGRLVETGPVRDLFHRPHHPYTELLIRSVPSIRHGGDTLTGAARRARELAAAADELAKTGIPPLREVGPGHLVALP